MQEFYVLTVRFCALILEIPTLKNLCDRISYRTYHGSGYIDIRDCVNGWASFSVIPATLSQIPAMNMP